MIVPPTPRCGSNGDDRRRGGDRDGGRDGRRSCAQRRTERGDVSVSWSALVATGDGQDRPGDVGRLVGGEEADRRRLFVQGAVAAHHRGVDGLLDDLRVPGLLLLCPGVAAPGDLPLRRERAPGAVATTRTPCGAASSASAEVRPLTPPLDAA